MPTYEYECLDCGENFEVFQMMSDKPIKSCPKCHGSVRRLIGSGSGFIFRGPGFYATDYRKAKPAQGAEQVKDNKACPEEKGCTQKRQPDSSARNDCPSKQGEDK